MLNELNISVKGRGYQDGLKNIKRYTLNINID